MTVFSPCIRPPKFIRSWFSDALWTRESGESVVYLTFDDGPVPEATPWLLEILEKESANATFFVLGRMYSDIPEFIGRSLTQGILWTTILPTTCRD